MLIKILVVERNNNRERQTRENTIPSSIHCSNSVM